MTGRPPAPAVELPAGQCMCGRKLPDGCPSDWACSESCQSAWLHHMTIPGWPHPQEIRARADQALAARTRPRPAAGRDTVPYGTEIDVDGQPYVRDGAHWQQVGMWVPASEMPARMCQYRRWCPHCRRRVPTLLHQDTDGQECAGCGHRWPGRPLLGMVEQRDGPWPGIRLRLSDGVQSATATYPSNAVGELCDDRIRRAWLRLERQLGGGFADIDEPCERELRIRLRRLARAWHYHTNPT